MQQYDLVLTEEDEKFLKVLNHINERLDETYNKVHLENVFVDVCGFSQDGLSVTGLVEFNKYTGDDEFRIMDMVEEYAQEVGAKVDFADLPNVDYSSTYSYDVEITVGGN